MQDKQDQLATAVSTPQGQEATPAYETVLETSGKYSIPQPGSNQKNDHPQKAQIEPPPPTYKPTPPIHEDRTNAIYGMVSSPWAGPPPKGSMSYHKRDEQGNM